MKYVELRRKDKKKLNRKEKIFEEFINWYVGNNEKEFLKKLNQEVEKLNLIPCQWKIKR